MWSWVESGAGAAAAGGASAGEAEDAEEPDEAEFETRRVLHELTALHATRYYFALIKIIPSQVSIATTTGRRVAYHVPWRHNTNTRRYFLIDI